jgi:hypothetical protein
MPQYCTIFGTGWNLEAPLFVRNSPGVDISPSAESVNSSSGRKKLISLIKFDESFYLQLHNKPRCHVVSKALSIFKNTAATHVIIGI